MAHALPISGGLIGWYDAGDIDGNPLTPNPPSGTAVGTWVNKANPGVNNAIATGTTPTLQASPMNGFPVIRFPGTSGTGYDLGTFRDTDGAYHYFGVTAASSSQLGVSWQRTISSFDSLTSSNDWTGSSWTVPRPLARWATDGSPIPYPPPYSGFVREQSAASGKKIKAVRLGRNAQSGTEWFNGDMSEVFLYDRQLNMAERIIMQNYLLAKYNGTNAQTASTPQNPTPTVLPPTNDFYAGDDAAKGHYDWDVFGVGRYDAANIFANSGVTTIPNAGLILEAVAGLDDGEWLLAGHRTLTNSWVTADLPPDTDQRWDRVWYLDFTGEFDARVTFDFSEGGLAFAAPPPGKVFDLLYSPTNAFAFERFGVLGSVAGDEVSFLLPGGTYGDGYFTLALADAIPEPASLSLLAAGIAALALRRRARRWR